MDGFELLSPPFKQAVDLILEASSNKSSITSAEFDRLIPKLQAIDGVVAVNYVHDLLIINDAHGRGLDVPLKIEDERDVDFLSITREASD